MGSKIVKHVWLLAAGLVLAGPTGAQLPPVQLPQVQVPGVQVPGLPEATRAVNGTLRELAGARALRVEQLARRHRAELDRIDGELVVRAEVIAVDITQPALDRALAEGFVLGRTRQLADLGIGISVLRTPAGWNARRGLKRLRKLDPQGSYDFNHVYLDGGEVAVPGVKAPVPVPAASTASHRVGLIDGGVDGAHERFAGRKIQRYGCDGKLVPNTHGTAVAAILLSRQSVDEIYAADVYCGQPAGGAADAVAAAFAWLARERVAVINVSLVGPKNVLLERVVSTLVRRGFLIVAAVGNDGPAAAPLYPASYEGVVGVTAVDRNHRVLIEACRGKQVDFAAQGSDFEAASSAPASYAPVRGTSFAAPVVAALLAELHAPDPAASGQVLARWTGLARDLGQRGRDDVYGVGQVGDTPAAPVASQGSNK
jgi:hypothetical protein